MTLSTDDTRIPYAGNGVTVEFNGPKVFSASHLKVYSVDDATGVSTLLTLTTDYAVTQIGLAQSLVTMVEAPADGTTLVLSREVPLTQTTSIKNQSAYFPEIIENAFDLVVMMILQLVNGIGLTRVLALFVEDEDGSGRYDGRGNRIVDIADGIAASDAATVGQIAEGSGAFVGEGTGAVARTLLAKNRDHVSVLDFGVPADGASDIGATLAAAIDNRSEGKALRFPAGDYYLVGSLDVTLTSPLELILDPGARIVGDTADIPMLMIRGGASRHPFSLVGGQLDNGDRTYNAAQQSGTALALFDVDDFYIAGTTFGRKTRDWVDNFGDSGISTNKCQRGTVIGCSFYGQPDLGIYTTGGADAAETDDYGDIVVQGCRFYRCNAGVSSKRGLARLIAQGNTFVECRLGVTIFEAGGVVPGRQSVVASNTFKKTQQYPIRVHGEGCAAITGNIIEDIGFDRSNVSGTARGIWLNGASRCVVANNVIRFRDWVTDSNHTAIEVRGATIDAIAYAGEENHVSDNLIENVYYGVVESSAGVNHYPTNSMHGVTTAFSGMNAGARGSYWNGTTFRSLIAGTAYEEEGTYEPTLTNTSNIAASENYVTNWARVGKTVMVSGKVDITCTANSTATELRISLPITPAFTDEAQAGGTASPGDVTGAGSSGGIRALSGGGVVRLRYLSGTASTASRTWYFDFTYRIP